jgi:siroheme synthase
MPESRERCLPLSLAHPAPFDLVCVGSSLCGYHGITLDAVRHLQVARRVFVYALNQEHFDFLHAFNPSTFDLNQTHYVDGTGCLDTYRDIVDFVLVEARAGGVAYVSQGSPVFQTYTALELVRRARSEGLTARILPGVSSLECLLTAIGIDQQIDELQIHTCRAVATGAARLDPHTPCLLFNVSVYAAAVVNTRGNLMRRHRLEALAASLRATYPSDHKVSVLHLNPSGGLSSISSTIAKLTEDLVAQAQPGVTLHIDSMADALL